jgi:molybdopterin/thiamine biosynthesis adenylyltransferase
MPTDHNTRRATVLYPKGLPADAGNQDLYGYAHHDTRQIVVVAVENPPAGCSNLSNGLDGPQLEASYKADGWHFHWQGEPCTAQPYGLTSDLFSRHTGLLETTAMQRSGAIICGCGSVGSLAALDLARSGVGRFLLIDDDILAVENLCRHQCGLPDVGRFKAKAVADRIRQINPAASVQVHCTTLERLDPATLADFTTQQPNLLLACADSRRADHYAARLAAQLQIPFLSIGLWERAFAGELFYWHSQTPMPCYSCAFQGLTAGLQHQQPEPRRRFYSTETELEKLNFQPGIGVDIAFVTQIGLKLALDLLNLGQPNHVPRLLNHLSQYTLVCNSNDARLGGATAQIFSHPLQVTTSIQVKARESCPICQEQH